jgi:hypothetical protein
MQNTEKIARETERDSRQQKSEARNPNQARMPEAQMIRNYDEEAYPFYSDRLPRRAGVETKNARRGSRALQRQILRFVLFRLLESEALEFVSDSGFGCGRLAMGCGRGPHRQDIALNTRADPGRMGSPEAQVRA